MNQYGKIIDGNSSVTCMMMDERRYIYLVKSDTCPEGFYPIEKDRPIPSPVGNDVLWFTYELVDGVLHKHYFCKPIPRKFSKLKIYGAISSVGTVNGESAWSRLQSWLESKNINGMNGWLAFQLAQDISDSHPLFEALSEEARVLLGLTNEQFESMLNACILTD